MNFVVTEGDPEDCYAHQLPDGRKANGLLHFYKKKNEWMFVTEDEYELQRDSLPPLTFATWCPIENMDTRTWHDLDKVAKDCLDLEDEEDDQIDTSSLALTTKMTSTTRRTHDLLLDKVDEFTKAIKEEFKTDIGTTLAPKIALEFDPIDEIYLKKIKDEEIKPEGSPDEQGRLKFAKFGQDGNRFTYEGQLIKKDDKYLRDGVGTFTNSKGMKYEGHWKDDKPSGAGKLVYPNGDRIEGNWVDGLLSGTVKEEKADGTRFEGEYVKAKREGRGKITAADGSTFEGMFKSNDIVGDGKFTFADNQVYEGDPSKEQRMQKIKCDKTGEIIDGIRYHSPYRYEMTAKELEANFSEDAMLEGGYPVRSFVPMIFYRISRPILLKKITNLPTVSFFGAKVDMASVAPEVVLPAKPPDRKSVV